VALTEDDPLRWRSAAIAACGRDFRTFTGYDVNSEDSSWDISVILEDDVSDTPVVSCTVVRIDREKWAGTAESITGSYLGIEVGDCFDFPTDTANAVEIDCAMPHEGEMFVVDASLAFLGESATYPTDDEWNDIASELCDSKFERYTGVDPMDPTSDLSYVFLFTLEADWVYPESRLLSCAVVMYDGTRLTDSVRV
ncbi:MAG: septum formation family protein, partial [Ilumatobacteraceae bacterium]